jgi:RNA polymerase-binding transcription factor DksA
MFDDRQLSKYKKVLKDRYRSLREEIRQELIDSDNQHFIDLAGQVHDLEEESVADLLVDLDLAIIDLHISEIREIDAALMRLARGGYGACTDCGEAIATERLRAQPAASRCSPCQSHFERNHAGPRRSTM